MKDIKRALLGDDGTGLKSGIVYEISRLKSLRETEQSWINFLKPIGVSVVTTAVLTFLITRFA